MPPQLGTPSKCKPLRQKIHKFQRILSVLILSLPVVSTHASQVYSESSGYAHHNDQSGTYNVVEDYTVWQGAHQGCDVEGVHHHTHTQGALQCDSAYSNPAVLWPANHKFQTIDIEGVFSISGQTPSIEIQCVTQDEPLNSAGDGLSLIHISEPTRPY